MSNVEKLTVAKISKLLANVIQFYQSLSCSLHDVFSKFYLFSKFM